MGPGYRDALANMLPLSAGLFRATLRAERQRSLLGYLWLFLPAAAAVATASYVRLRGFIDVPRLDMPYPVFVFAGTVLWQVFLEALNAPLTQLASNRALVSRISFPHEGLVLSGIWMVFLNAAVRFAALLGLCALLRANVAVTILLMPLGVFALALVGLAFGFLIAPFGLLYDDVGRGLAMITLLLFFLMPVAYPISGSGWQALNPVLPLINLTRAWLVGVPYGGTLLVPAIAGCMLPFAWAFYRLAQPHVVERL